MLALPTHLNSNAFAMTSSLVAHVLSVSHLPSPIPADPPIYLPLQKSILNMISEEITRLSNRICGGQRLELLCWTSGPNY